METIQAATRRLRAEYLEMPGLRLTVEQVQRLCGIDPAVCQAVLDALVAAQFLRLTPRGYVRLTSGGDVPRLRPAKADLHPRRKDSSKAS